MSKKVRLTKNLQRYYHQVLAGNADHWFYHHPCSWGVSTNFVPITRAASSAWQAYLFAKNWGCRDGVDLKRLETIVYRGGDPECCYCFARDIPSSNVKKLQRAVAMAANAKVIEKFILNIPGANVKYLKNMLIIIEVMRN